MAEGPTKAASTLRVTVNGAERDVPAGLSVAGLVALLGMEPGQVAVERNRDVVPRLRHAETPLADGDRLEVVGFVGGG